MTHHSPKACAASAILAAALFGLLACSESSSTAPDGGNGPHGPSGWFWQNPQPFGHPLNQIDAPAATVGVALAVGPAGLIVRTDDGGSTWQRQMSGTDENLSYVSFYDAQAGFAAGATALLRTSDGGSTWTDLSAAVPALIRDISATGPLSAKAISSRDELGTTIDGGLNWTWRPLPAFTRGYAMDFPIASTGFVAAFDWTAAHAIGLSTTDGGNSWTRVDTGLNFIPNAVFGWDANRAWIVGANGTVLRTIDGGQSWQASSITDSFGNPRLTSVVFVSATVGYATSVSRRIFKSTDGGNTWSQVWENSVAVLESIVFSSGTQGIAVGSGGTILLSQDGGANWTSGNATVAPYRLSDVSFSSTQHGVAVGYDQILRTTDGGEVWVDESMNQSGAPVEWLVAVSFADASHGAAVGDGGEITWSNDGGRTWVRQTNPTNRPLGGVHVRDAQNAMAVGGYGMVILKTADAGNNWEAQLDRASSDSLLSSVWMIDGQRAIAVGSDEGTQNSGIILRTIDGGSSWQPVTGFDQSEHYYYDVCFVNADLGFIAGFDVRAGEGLILRTTDGGLSWEHRATGLNLASLESISFSDASHGIAVGGSVRGRSGQIAITIDGGSSWQTQISGVGLGFYGVAMQSASTATIVGDNGLILRTTTGGVQ